MCVYLAMFANVHLVHLGNTGYKYSNNVSKDVFLGGWVIRIKRVDHDSVVSRTMVNFQVQVNFVAQSQLDGAESTREGRVNSMVLG